MNRTIFIRLATAACVPALLFAIGCSGRSNDNMDSAELAPPPPAAEDTQAAGVAPEPPAPEPPSAVHPQRTKPAQPVERVAEERPRPVAPPPPARIVLNLPAGTGLSVNLPSALTSETALVGDKVGAKLNNAIIVGDRVAFPAGSSVTGTISDVKSAKKGFKDTGGALSIHFDRITAPDGHSASIDAGFTKVATGSAGKKAGIIGGSAVGGALLGKVLGKDEKGAAVIGGAIGTAVAGSTKGKEAVIQPEEEIHLSLERASQTSVHP